MLSVLTRSSLQEGEGEEIFETFEIPSTGLKTLLRVKVIKCLVVIHLLNRVVWILLADYELHTCLSYALYGIKHKGLAEFRDVRGLVNLSL